MKSISRAIDEIAEKKAHEDEDKEPFDWGKAMFISA